MTRLLAQQITTRPSGPLTVSGRNTGRPHTTPVAVFEGGGRYWLAGIFGNVNWARNLRATGEPILTRGRSRRAVVAPELSPQADPAVLRDAVAADAFLRLAAWFVRRYVADGSDALLTEFVAAARQHLVFEPREASHVVPPTVATLSTTGGFR